jgi:MFS family permease
MKTCERAPLQLSQATTLHEDSSKGMSHATKALLVLTGVALLVNYVETMIIPGVPVIQKQFLTTATIASWITSAYLIVGSAVSPLFGKLGDIYGKRKLFLVSMSFYTVGVGMGGFSPSIYFLIFARALQGVGFAIIPLGLAIIVDEFPVERIAAAQGIISGTFAIGAAAGLVVGAYIVQDFGWQYAFHSALVLSILLFVVSFRVLRKDVPNPKSKAVDYAGAGILMAGITLVLVWVTEGPTLGWVSSEEVAFLVPGAVLTAGFFLFEARRRNPLIQLKLLRLRNVLVANLLAVVSGAVMFMLFFALVYYAELPLGFGLSLDVIAAGLTLAPSTVGMLFGGLGVGRALPRIGPKPVLLLGSLLLGSGLALFLFSRGTSIAVSADLFVSLAGVICLLVPLVNMIAVTVPRESIAVGLGMNTMLRNLGGAIGPVVATAIMASYTEPLTVKGQVVGQLPSPTAFNTIFEVGIALTVLVLLLGLATKNYTFRRREN